MEVEEVGRADLLFRGVTAILALFSIQLQDQRSTRKILLLRSCAEMSSGMKNHNQEIGDEEGLGEEKRCG